MIVFFSDSVSVTTLTVTGPVVSVDRLRVRPSTMFESVLLGDVTARPLTVAAASAAVWLCVIVVTPAEGSNASEAMPEVNASAAPEVLDRIRRRERLRRS